jgi:hypothetical protein
LPSAQQKALGKSLFAVSFFTMSDLPSVTLGKAFAECFLKFAECYEHSANRLFPVVRAWRISTYPT